jgi:hypothetical protein
MGLLPPEPEVLSSSGRSVWREPADRPHGDRHRDGVNWDQARVRNVGTCCVDAKGKGRREEPGRLKVRRRHTGADYPVVVLTSSNEDRAKGVTDSAKAVGQPAMGGIHV